MDYFFTYPFRLKILLILRIAFFFNYHLCYGMKIAFI
jgi:hypothetical protein